MTIFIKYILCIPKVSIYHILLSEKQYGINLLYFVVHSSPLPGRRLVNMFFQTVASLSMLLRAVFSFDEIQLSKFYFIDHAFSVLSKSLPNPKVTENVSYFLLEVLYF